MGHSFRLDGKVLVTLLCSLLSAAILPAQVGSDSRTSQITYQAAAMMGKGDYDGAANLCRQALQTMPDQASLYMCIGDASLKRENYPVAVEAYEKAVPLLQRQPRSTPNVASTNATLAALYVAMNRLDEAEDHIDKAIALLPGNAGFYNTKGTILESRGQLDAAIEACRTSLAAAPKWGPVLQNLGSALQKKGKLDEAISMLQSGVQLYPNDPDLHAAYGNALLAAGRPAQAEPQYQASLASRPDNSSVLYNLADAQRRQLKFPEAVVNLKKAYALAPEDADTNLALGSLLVQTGQTAEAYPYLQASRRSGKFDAEAFYAVALACPRKATETRPCLPPECADRKTRLSSSCCPGKQSSSRGG